MYIIEVTAAAGGTTWREWYNDGRDAAREVQEHRRRGRKVKLIVSVQERPLPVKKPRK